MTIDDQAREPASDVLRRLVTEQVESRPPAPEWSTLGGVSKPDRRRRRPVVGVAVAASIAGLIVGLIVLDGRRPDAERSVATAHIDPAPEVAQRVLADVEQVAPDAFVVPAERPGSVEFQYAIRTPGPEDGMTTRTVRAGNEQNPEALVVHVDVGDRPPAFADPVDVGGREWLVSDGPGGWSAFTTVGESDISVYGSGRFFDEERSVLAELRVLPATSLQHPPLDPTASMIEVASSGSGGERGALQVQISNGYVCSRTMFSSGSSGSCGSRLVERAVSVFAEPPSGGNYDWVEGADVVAAAVSGIVYAEVASVDVEFTDGTTMSVAPVDESGTFDELRFWVLSAEVGVEPALAAAGADVVREVRAYDRDGELLEIARPGR